jgi:transcriptional regulator with XRE-family HTH domain
MEELENIKKALGARVRELRKMSGYRSVEDLADRVGVSTTTIYELERGENWISPEMAQSLAAALQCPVSAFFDRVDESAKPAKLRLFELIATLDESKAKDLLPSLEALVVGKLPSPRPLESPKPIQKQRRLK